ncbi:MAG: type I-E CRISPR-associated protein Cas6/Cse3/CasE [Deferribacterales bacterium]|nr:type I-E CRISPR-associated protein Cas6/Cse3/CasE [Deferribacterales bacterium]
MILTQINFSYKDIKQNKIYTIYDIHKNIWKLFDAENRKKQGERILFADKGMVKDKRKVLVMSDTPAKENNFDMNFKEIPENYLNYDLYNFEININPVKKCPSLKKLLSITNYNEISDWFIKKANSHGFSVVPASLMVNKVTATEFTKSICSYTECKKENKATATELTKCNGNKLIKVVLNTANITGILKVTDRNKFIDSVHYGIGRGKAYGHGLLQITPASIF